MLETQLQQQTQQGKVHMPESDKDKPEIHNRITTLRREAGVSRKEMADAVGINENTLAVIERGEREPRVRVAWRIAEYFDLPLKAVFADGPVTPLAEVLREQYRCTSYRSSANQAEEDKP